MRNLKKILCLALVLCMVLAVVSGAAYKDYADADEITKANEDYLLAAELLKDIGVVVGVEEDGKTYYKPDALLTRAELARILYVLHSGNTEGIYANGAIFEHLNSSFTDIKGHWAENYIKYGQNAGYLNGKSAAIFDPDANVKTEEMATALLIVIGYKAADLAPNYPFNVVKYGYVGNEGNLFTTGLSDAYQSEDTGAHVVGLGTGVGGVYVYDTEKELYLGTEVTREEAFFMMYKAITQREMVSKMDSHHNAEGEFYFDTDELYVNYKFDMDFAQTEVEGVVSGTPGYNFQGGYAAAGKVVIEDADGNEAIYNDFGYFYTLKTATTAIGYGFTFQATNWDSHIGRAIVAKNTTWAGKSLLTHYAFDFAPNGTTYGLKGINIKIAKDDVKIEAKDGKLVITGQDLSATPKKFGDKDGYVQTAFDPYYADGYRFICNFSDGVVKATAADLAALLESKINSEDEIVLKAIQTGKDADGKPLYAIYGIIEEQNIFAEVTADTDKNGMTAIKYVGGETDSIKAAGLKKGDRVFGFYNEKSKAWELTKVEPTAIVNVAVETIVTTADDKTSIEYKYYMDKVGGTEIVLGKAFAKTEYKSFEAPFVPNEPVYWALYFVGDYCFDAVKTAQVAKKDMTVIAKTVIQNTIDNTNTYVFTLEDAAKNVVTFTDTLKVGKDDALIAHYGDIVAKSTVIYTYESKTLEGISIQEFRTIKAKTVKVLANEALGNIDTECATAASVIEALALAAAETDVEFRIVLPAKNGGADKAPIAGEATQEAQIVIGANVVIADYQFVTLPSLS